MNKILIKPQWLLKGDGASQQQSLPVLLRLLAAIYEEKNLSKACRTVGLSYRHAWGLIKNGRQIFGVPLANFTRGQGATLTPLGEKLVWADKRIGARLAPILESVASEVEAEIERARADSKTILRIHGSHGYAVAALRDFLVDRGITVELQFRGGADALTSLYRLNCELAGFHVPQGDLQARALEHYIKWLKPRSQRLINLVTRRQGIMVAKGNPKKIAAVTDFARSGVRFANRQRGSGTRLLLELLLSREKLSSSKISGFEVVEFTHDAVAAYIASGMADTGLGVETAARKFDLDFIPLVSERYFLACHVEAVMSQPVQEVVSVLRSNEFRALINDHHGLDSAGSGTIIAMDEAFSDFALARSTHGHALTRTTLLRS
jgi:molybdate transport repressor ModE-like protein